MLVDSAAYFWLPHPLEGYKALGYLVTNSHDKPSVDEISCVRVGLTDTSETYHTLLDTRSFIPGFPFWVENLRPCNCNMLGTGVSGGIFSYSNCCWNRREELPVMCLNYLNQTLPKMPQIDRIHALIELYGPTISFNPEEVYLPSSIDWLLSNGASLYQKGLSKDKVIDEGGSNLPSRGINDIEFWIELSYDDIRREFIKEEDLESAKLYVHEKPTISGTFNDIVIWIFCLFNGPSTMENGIKNMVLSKVGSHVGDWEHFTFRICNFSGELWSKYFSQHSVGKWVDAHELEYIDGDKATVYSLKKKGHASYLHHGKVDIPTLFYFFNLEDKVDLRGVSNDRELNY
ncbi:hypothetical protein At1g04090-like [Vicia villosa]|uniref:hypothetical protein At1g04090-like n=1 Tax=Vicia villosa TaxID=3911 RepID=UPI00273B202B|nr:hypothetical protein At1g04090-like [Vicia villosa]